jgi:hypothetical protein
MANAFDPTQILAVEDQHGRRRLADREPAELPLSARTRSSTRRAISSLMLPRRFSCRMPCFKTDNTKLTLSVNEGNGALRVLASSLGDPLVTPFCSRPELPERSRGRWPQQPNKAGAPTVGRDVR